MYRFRARMIFGILLCLNSLSTTTTTDFIILLLTANQLQFYGEENQFSLKEEHLKKLQKSEQ